MTDVFFMFRQLVMIKKNSSNPECLADFFKNYNQNEDRNRAFSTASKLKIHIHFSVPIWFIS